MQAVHPKGATWTGLTNLHLAVKDDGISPASKLGLFRAPLRTHHKPSKSALAVAALKRDGSEKPFETSLDLSLESSKRDPQSAERRPLQSAIAAARSAVESGPVESVGTVAMYSGAAAMTMLMSGAVLHSVDVLPLVPQVLQLLGVSASGWLATHYVSVKAGANMPSSPIRALSQLLDQRPGSVSLDLSDVSGLDEGAKRKLKTLTEQRDSAVAELEDVKGAVNKMALLVAEKEALEAVAMQLAEERDEAMGEVHKLKSAVDGMTERMRAIEAMLAQEVGELRQQNQALETVAIQLASERDSALNKVADLENALELSCKALAEKVAVQTVAARLAEERDDALKELAELRQLVASLQVDTESGLTPESEVFLKSRLRDVRSNFVNVDKTFDEQPEAVERLVCHLVEEFGAPRQWTRDYLKQFLQSSAGRSNSLSGTGVPSLSLDREAAKMS